MVLTDDKGGTMAMDIKDDLVVAISPNAVQIFSLADILAAERETAQHLRKIELSVSVGFADVKILEPAPGFPPTECEVRIALAGEEGIFLCSVVLGRTVESATSVGESLVLAWHQPVVAGLDASYPMKPLIDSFGTVSWLESIIPEKETSPVHQFSFHTLSRRPKAPHPQSDGTLPHVYVLDRPELPALYAMGVYDYDASLGLAIFGNYYGEIVLFDLSGSSSGTGAHQSSFVPLTILTESSDRILPEVRGMMFKLPLSCCADGITF